MKPLKDYNQSELIAMVEFYRDREKYFAKILMVSDGGQFRADWDAVLIGLITERNRLSEQLEAFEGASLAARQKNAENENLKALLNRAMPFLLTSDCKPLVRDAMRILKGEIDPGERVNVLRDALALAIKDLTVWHGLHTEDLGAGDKTNLDHFLNLLGYPKRYDTK